MSGSTRDSATRLIDQIASGDNSAIEGWDEKTKDWTHADLKWVHDHIDSERESQSSNHHLTWLKGYLKQHGLGCLKDPHSAQRHYATILRYQNHPYAHYCMGELYLSLYPSDEFLKAAAYHFYQAYLSFTSSKNTPQSEHCLRQLMKLTQTQFKDGLLIPKSDDALYALSKIYFFGWGVSVEEDPITAASYLCHCLENIHLLLEKDYEALCTVATQEKALIFVSYIADIALERQTPNMLPLNKIKFRLLLDLKQYDQAIPYYPNTDYLFSGKTISADDFQALSNAALSKANAFHDHKNHVAHLNIARKFLFRSYVLGNKQAWSLLVSSFGTPSSATVNPTRGASIAALETYLTLCPAIRGRSGNLKWAPHINFQHENPPIPKKAEDELFATLLIELINNNHSLEKLITNDFIAKQLQQPSCHSLPLVIHNQTQHPTPRLSRRNSTG